MCSVINRRVHPRSSTPVLFVVLHDICYRSFDWSLNGCLLSNYGRSETLGALLKISSIGKSKNDLHQVEIRARVVRFGKNSTELGLQFLDLDVVAYRLLTEIREDMPSDKLVDKT